MKVLRNMVLNAFAWTSTQVNKITIRPPDRDISTLDLTNELYLKIVFFSIDAFPTLLIAMGIAIFVSAQEPMSQMTKLLVTLVVLLTRWRRASASMRGKACSRRTRTKRR